MTRLWELLACILHLGNAKIIAPNEKADTPPTPPTADEEASAKSDSGSAREMPPKSHKEPRCTIQFDTMPMENICEILGTSTGLFCDRLVTRMIKADNRSSIKISILSPVEVKNNIYSLMKYLYGGIFSWLVKKINYAHGRLAQTVSSPFSVVSPSQALTSFSSTGSFGSEADDEAAGCSKFIGILDIFGFEILAKNSFEQLCINYANERLQQQFNENIFVNEQKEYEAEGVPVPTIVYLNNQDVIDLFAKKPSGVFILLEQYSLLNRNTDSSVVVSNFSQCHKDKNSAFGLNKFDKTDFVVHHFAGDVTYSAVGLLEKNNDALQEDLKLLVTMSKSEFVLDITHMETDSASQGHAASSVGTKSSFLSPSDSTVSVGGGGRKMAATSTVSFKFREQLQDLMMTLRATQPHYIKCVKPNGSKEPHKFTSALAMQQLLYSGVLDVVRIRRQGYPIQSAFKSFHKALHLLLYGTVQYKVNHVSCSEEQSKDLCGDILSMFLTGDLYAVGKNKVFLKETAPDILTAALMQRRHQIAARIQTSWRFHITHWKFKLLRRSAVKTQEFYLTRYYHKRYMKSVMGMTYVKAWWNRRKVQRAYIKLRTAAILIEAVMRMKLARMLLIRLRENKAASQLAKWVMYINTRYALRSVLINFRKSIIILQAKCRAKKPQKVLSIKKVVAAEKAVRQQNNLSKKKFVAAQKIQIAWRLHKKGLALNAPIKDLVVKSMVELYVKNLIFRSKKR